MEGPNGEPVESQAELELIVDRWEREAQEGKGRVIAMSAVVSFPRDVAQEAATDCGAGVFPG